MMDWTAVIQRTSASAKSVGVSLGEDDFHRSSFKNFSTSAVVR